MTQAQRGRDAALRRLRLANRGGLAASVVGAAVVIGLAHQATPVGTSRRVATQIAVSRYAGKSRSHSHKSQAEKAVRHRIEPAAAPTAVTTSASSASTSTPATVTPVTSVTPVAVAAPVTSGAS